MNNEDKRKFTRVEVRIPVYVHPKDDPNTRFDAVILDISEGGAFVHCTAPIPIGREVFVEIRFAESTLLEGKVVPHEALLKAMPKTTSERSVIKWVRGSSRSGFGIEFVGMKAETREFLQKFVNYFGQAKDVSKAG